MSYLSSHHTPSPARALCVSNWESLTWLGRLSKPKRLYTTMLLNMQTPALDQDHSILLKVEPSSFRKKTVEGKGARVGWNKEAMSSRCSPRASRAPCFWAPDRHQGKPQGLWVQDQDTDAMSVSAGGGSVPPCRAVILLGHTRRGREKHGDRWFPLGSAPLHPQANQTLCCAVGSPGWMLPSCWALWVWQPLHRYT